MSSTERLAPPGPIGASATWAPASLRGKRYGEDRLHLLVRDPRRVLAIWELSQATASGAAVRAREAGAPVRYQVRIERAREDDLPPTTIATADLPDALGGEGWYLAIPPKAGRCRAVIGLDLPSGFAPLLTSRWAATPPDAPCEEVAPWPLSAEGEAWAARQWARALAERAPAPSSAARYLPPPAKQEPRR
ncbi:MAG TPA: DUF4912 domain-containing protein [Candidatus Eisenbacteria bacterium]